MAKEITVKSGKGEMAREPVTFTFDIGENLQDAIAKFGEPAVWSMYERGITVAAQAPARQLLAAGATAEKVQEHMRVWKPGVTAPRAARTGDPLKQILADFEKYSPEQKQEMLDTLMKLFSQSESDGATNEWHEPPEETPHDEFADEMGEDQSREEEHAESGRRRRR
jgi:hypothetical protein